MGSAMTVSWRLAATTQLTQQFAAAAVSPRAYRLRQAAWG
jgi:hypothetical protein